MPKPTAEGTGAMHNPTLVYVGTYTHGKSEGIYVCRLDTRTGAMHVESVATGIRNPSFLALDAPRRRLFAVNEMSDFGGARAGAVSAFAIAPDTGALTLLNQQSTVGSGPCHLTVDRSGRFVLAANYGSGSVVVLPVGEDGSLGEATDFVQHQGSGADPRRQEGPHAHSITLDAANRFAFAADLGLDRVFIYRFDSSQGKLTPNDQPWVETAPGAGPRHFAFHPSGRFAYLINELDNTLVALAYDPARGMLQTLQVVSTLPQGYTGTSYCADVHVAPSGRFVYGSNRGHDSIAIFAVAPETGLLTAAGYEPTGGKNPRNFALTPAGDLLLAANQDSDNIVAFRVDLETGSLTPTGQVTQIPTPVCVTIFAP